MKVIQARAENQVQESEPVSISIQYELRFFQVMVFGLRPMGILQELHLSLGVPVACHFSWRGYDGFETETDESMLIRRGNLRTHTSTWRGVNPVLSARIARSARDG